jgi:tRNA threonylcarbamoyladenosine biosynthesis protein TsaE
MKKSTYITHSVNETYAVAEEFAQSLKGGEVICLYGDLGYGKTTFTQGLAKGLGIRSKILSPTFIIVRSYKHTYTVYHIDLYRLTHEQEIIDLGVLDFMQDKENIVIIEWPEKMGTLLPAKRIDIVFDYLDEYSRNITINAR